MTYDLFDDHPFKGKTTKAEVSRISYGVPSIPDTGWKMPTDFPRLDAAKMLCIDLETFDPELKEFGPGWGRGSGHIVGVAVGTDDGKRWYFPMRHTIGPNLPPDAVLAWCRDTFGDARQPKVFANSQYDIGWLKQEGVDVAGQIIDVQIAEPLIDEHATSYSLDSLAVKYLGEHKVDSVLYDWSHRAYGGKPGRAQAANIYRCPASLVGPYAEGDVDLPLRIWAEQEKVIRSEGLEKVFRIESTLPQILVAMRMRGIRVDVEGAEKARELLLGKVKDIQLQIKSITGESVDLWANDSLAKAFDRVGLTYGKTATGKPSFTSEFLEHHPHEIAGLIRQARKYEKAVGTFIEGYLLKPQVGGRVFGQFHQLRGDDGGTVVGRFCVTGDTILETSAGNIRIDEFEPDGCATVISHTGKNRKVLKRIFKGKEKTVIICLTNGAYVRGTKNHRVLTPLGWKSIYELTSGMEVITYGRNNETPERSGYAEKMCRSVSRRTETHDGANGEECRNELPHVIHNFNRRCSPRKTETGESVSLFGIQSGSQPSFVGKKRGGALQLQRYFNVWSERVSSYIASGLVYWSKFEACLSSSSCVVPTSWFNRYSGWLGRASYRWRCNEQYDRQLSVNDSGRTPPVARSFTIGRIQDICESGEESIWDIEVEGDHSYCAQGLVHHNSSSLPNLENIPARDPEIGALVRGLFLPEEGSRWRCHDFSQIQFREICHYAVGKSGEDARRKYNEDPNTDYHDLTKQLIYETTGQDLSRKTVKCIAEGQLVLTDKGLVPIEKVTSCLRVWDGVKFVDHDGVIYKGYQEVITYDGLTATPDHKVWLQTGECIPIGEASSQMDRPRLATGEINGKAVRFSHCNTCSGFRTVCKSILLFVRRNVLDRVFQLVIGKNIQQMSVSDTRSSIYGRRTISTRYMGSCEETLRETYESIIQELRSAGDTITNYAGRFCELVQRTLSKFAHPKIATGSYGQQWTLRNWEYPICIRKRKFTEHEKVRDNYDIREKVQQSNRSGRMAFSNISKFNRSQRNVDEQAIQRELDTRADTFGKEKRKAHVYDIVNAGPNHRFTVNGKIVSNCVNFGLAFTMGVDKLANELGLTVEEARPLIDGYHQGVPFVRETSEKVAAVAAQRGYLIDIIGRRHRFPFWEPRDWKLRKEIPMSKDYAVVASGVEARTGKPPTSRDIVRAFTHLGLNRLAQSGEGDHMKKAIVDCWEAGLFDVLGPALNIVHDDISINNPGGKEGEEAVNEVRRLMSKAIAWKVPILVSAEEGETWGSVGKIN